MATEEEKLIRLGQLKAECDEAFICISHGVPIPCDICEAESDEHAPHAAKCGKCGFKSTSAHDFVVGTMHQCHSIDKYHETGHVSFEPDSELVRKEHEREDRELREKHEHDARVRQEAEERERASSEMDEKKRAARALLVNKLPIIFALYIFWMVGYIFLANIASSEKSLVRNELSGSSEQAQSDDEITPNEPASISGTEPKIESTSQDNLNQLLKRIEEIGPEAASMEIPLEALELLSKNSNQKVMLTLALALANGGEEDIRRARVIFKHLADKGNAIGQLRLARMAFEGAGGPVDSKVAEAYLLQSANKGNPDAMFEVAQRREHGDGMEKSQKKALYWYRKLQKAGDPRGDEELARLESNVESTQMSGAKPATSSESSENVSNVPTPNRTPAVPSSYNAGGWTGQEPTKNIHSSGTISESNSPSGTVNTAKPEASGQFKAKFRGAFGRVVEKRVYPTEAMKQQALELWEREQKILEPEGTINEQYVTKQQGPCPIPGAC